MNIPHSIIDRVQKNSKESQDLNKTVNQLVLINIYRILQMIAEYTVFSEAHATLFRIDRSDKRMKKSAGDSDFQLFKSLQSFSFSRLSFQIQWSRDKLSIDTMCVSTLKCLPTDSMSIIKSRRFYALNFS